jgi:hypothetical protein
MGCDIHIYVEHRVEGEWRLLEEVPLWTSVDGKTTNTYSTRDYDLFGILADVRNGSGHPPISESKGLPTDVSPSLRAAYKAEGEYLHSASYLTLAEIVRYNWNRSWEYEDLTRRELVGEEWFCFLAALDQIDDDPKNVRIVFWFDS